MAGRDRSGRRVRIGGQTVTLARLVKSGGAGSIYLLAERPDSVAKLYHPSIDRAEYAAKIQAMLELTPKLAPRTFNDTAQVQIAWPSAPIHDVGRRFIGFAMPLLDIDATCELEIILQDRQAKAAGLTPSLGVKMTLAANLASVLAAVHREGHYVVDLKPVNLSFYRDSLYIALLDCDGFSIRGHSRRFPAGQFTPDYLAPEFQGRGVRAGDGEAQDLFALAVIVFRLLNFGIHPFTGRPKRDSIPTDIPARIRRWLYAYGRRAHPEIAPSPISGHEAMPDTLRAMFDAAFTGTDRPSAADWARALAAYARRDNGKLVVCDRDRMHQHFAGLPCAACARDAALTASRRNAGKHRRQRQQRRQQTRRRAQTHTRRTARQHQRATTTTSTRPTATGRPVTNVNRWTGALGTAAGVLIFIVFTVGQLQSCEHRAARRSAARYDASTTPAETRQPAGNPISAIQKVDAHADIETMRRTVMPVAHAMADGDPARYRSALQALKQTAASHPRPQPASLSAYYRVTADQSDDDALKRIVARDPFATFALIDLGEHALQASDTAGAGEPFTQAVWADPDQANAWYGLGVSHLDDDAALAAACIAIARMHLHRDSEAQTLSTHFHRLIQGMPAATRDALDTAETTAQTMADAIPDDTR